MEKVMNGVDLTKLMQIIEAIQSDPGLADFIFKAANRWINGGHSRTTLNEIFGTKQTLKRPKSFVVDSDEPPVLLGTDQGPNPGELVLAALSSCMTSTLAYHGAAEGYRVDSIESSFEADVDLKGFLGLDPKVRAGYREIRAHFTVKSEADKQKVEELLKRSPVYDIVSNPVRIVLSVQKK